MRNSLPKNYDLENLIHLLARLLNFENDIHSFLEVDERVLQVCKEEVLSDTCWAFDNITESTVYIDIMFDNIARTKDEYASIADIMLTLLDTCQTDRILSPAIRTIGNILGGDDEHTLLAIQKGCLDKLHKFISFPIKTVRQESIWAISNALAGNRECIQKVFGSGIFTEVIQACAPSQSFDIIREICWCISNALLKANHEQVFRIQISVILSLHLDSVYCGTRSN